MSADPSNSNATGINRRKWPRTNIEIGAVLRADERDSRLPSRIANISARGMFLVMDSPTGVGTRLSIEVYIPDEQITLRGVVVRAVPQGLAIHPGVGVFLTDVDERWTNFCATLSDPSLKAVDEEGSGPHRAGGAGR